MTLPNWVSRCALGIAERPVLAAAVLAVSFCVLAATAFLRAEQPLITTDMLALLGTPQSDPALEAALERRRQTAERQHIWIVTGLNRRDTFATAQQVQRQITASGLYVDAPTVRPNSVRNFYKPYSGRLATPRFIEAAAADTDEVLVNATLAELYGNAFGLQASEIAEDPLLAKSGFEQAMLTVPPPFRLDTGFLTMRSDEHWSVLVPATLRTSPFDFATQRQTALLERRILDDLAEPGLTVESIGIVTFATNNRAVGESEVQTVGSLSLVLVIVLICGAFRSARPLLAVVFSVGCGVASGFLLCAAVFGSVHLLTLVGGTSLVGIAVDHAFHVLADSYRKADRADSWTITNGLAEVLPTISLGLVTSIFGFIGLYVSGFRGLQEIATFAAGGLFGAFLVILLGFPLLLRGWKPRPPPAFVDRLEQAQAAWRVWWNRRKLPRPFGLAWLLPPIALTFALVIPALHDGTDLRLLSAQSAQEVSSKAQTVLRAFGEGRFVLLEADSIDELLARDEQLDATLQTLQQDGHVGYWNLLSRYVPSGSRQAAVQSTYAKLSRDGGAVDQIAAQIGLRPEVIARTKTQLIESQPLDLETWLGSPASVLGRDLWLGNEGPIASLVTLAGVGETDEVQRRVESIPGARLIDTAALTAHAFDEFVSNAFEGLAIAAILMTVVMVVRFGWIDGLQVVSVPALSCLLTIGSLLALGEQINLFHVVGFALVIGMGVDYILFLRRSRHDASTILGVILAALSTEAAFGLLSLSEVGAIHSFGATVAIGIAISFIVANIAGAQAHS